MKIVTYHGPESQKNTYLRVVEVHDPDSILGQNIVGIYPDGDVAPNRVDLFEYWRMACDRIFSRFPLKQKE